MSPFTIPGEVIFFASHASARFLARNHVSERTFVFSVTQRTTVHNERIITRSMMNIIAANGDQSRLAIPSDIGQQIEVLVIFVLSSLAFSHQLFRLDEFNPLDPLNHLVSELIFDAQPQWRSVDER